MQEVETTEQEQIEALKATLENNIRQSKALTRLKKNEDFKELISTIFIDDGKKYLWENIKNYEELELIEKGSTRTENINRMKTEVQARLIFERFLNQIELDAEHAEETLKQIEDMEDEDGSN